MIKLVLLFAGTLSFGLAIAGVFLPVLPTTPFVLLAIFLFSKGHPEKVKEVIEHPRLNPYIKDYLSDDGIPRVAKIRAICVLWISILISIMFIPSTLFRLVCLMSATSVTIYLLTRQTKNK